MENELKRRLQSPTPPFFRKLREVGMALVSASATFLMWPVDWPPTLLDIAGYMLVSGLVLATVCQITVEDRPNDAGRQS